MIINKFHYGNFIQLAELLTWCVLAIMLFANYELFYYSYYPLIVIYWLANFFVILLPNCIRHSLPVIIIGITGFIRFVLIPFTMIKENIIIDNSRIYLMMSVELISIYFAIFIFHLYKKYNLNDKFNKRYSYYVTTKSISIGLSVLCVLACGIIYIFVLNRDALFDYIILSTNRIQHEINTGYEGLLITAFFLLLYCIFLEQIKAIALYKPVGLVLMVILSIFFIKGRAFHVDNVSRTTILLSSLVCFMYISSSYPRYKKLLISLVLGAIVFAMTIGSMVKLERSGHSMPQTMGELMTSHFSFRSLNARCAGPLNYEYFLQMIGSNGTANGVSRIEILISDIFANFPLLNKFLSNKNEQSVMLFNYQIYHSSIAHDQIIPFACQFYLYVNILFFIPIMCAVFLSLLCNWKIKYENNKLKQFCLLYLTYALSLVNTTSFSVMLQHLWVSILPVFIIYRFNYRLKIK